MGEDCANYDLLRKHQPRRLGDKFEGLDSNVNRAIARGIATKKFPPHVLFSGSAGSGKGTTARIIGRRHCCQNKDQHPFDPCLKCEGCRSFHIGEDSLLHSVFGYSEFDATRLSGPTIAQYMEIASRYSPFEGGSRHMFVVDEIQRNRTGIQERLLRLTESIKNTIIICTIDAGVLLPALRDRFVHFMLRPPSREQAIVGLTRIANVEGFEIDRDAADLIARMQSNNPRRCVNLLGLAITVASKNTVGLDEVHVALDIAGESVVYD